MAIADHKRITTAAIFSTCFNVLLLLLTLAQTALAQPVDFNQQELDWIQRHPQISVGMDDRWPPIDFINASGQHQGISIDVLQLVASHTGIQFTPTVAAGWQDMLTKAAAHEIDIVATLAQNAEREKKWNFTESYFQFPYVITVRKDNDSVIDLSSLDGKTVAIEKGYFLQKALASHPKIRLLPVDSTAEALQAVSREQADAYVGNQAVIFYLIEQARLTNLKVAADAGFPVGKLHFGIRKDWPELVTIINKVLATTPSQQFKLIERNWLGLNQLNTNSLTPPAKIDFTPEQHEWLSQHPKLTAGVMDNWPPFDFVNENGVASGISVEIIQQINQRLDNRITIKAAQWSQIYSEVKNRKLDLILDITARPEREKDFNFTQPYLDIPHVIVGRRNSESFNDENELNNKTLALEQGFGNVGYFQKNYPSVKLKLYPDTEQALEAVSREEADAYAGNRVVALHLIEKLALYNLKIHGRLNKPGSVLSIGTRKDYPVLRDILQKTLDSIGNDKIREIKNSWIFDPEQEEKNIFTLSKAENHWLSQHRAIPIEVNGSWPPVDFYDDKQLHRGISADYLKLLSKKLGVEFSINNEEKTASTIQRVIEGKTPIVLSTSYNPKLTQELLYTRSFYHLKSVILTARDNVEIQSIKDLVGKSVAIEKGSSLSAKLRDKYPGIKLMPLASATLALEKINSREVDAYIGFQAETNWLLKQQSFPNIKTVAETGLDAQPLNFAVSKNAPEWLPFVQILDKAIASISSQEHFEIQQHWVTQTSPGDENIKPLILNKKLTDWIKSHPEIKPGVDTQWEPLEYLDDQGNYQGLSSDFIKYFMQQIGVKLKPPENIPWSQVLQGLHEKSIDIAPLLINTPERSQYLNFTRPYLTFPVVIFNQRGNTLLDGLTDLSGKKVGLVEGYAINELIKRDHPDIQRVMFQDTKVGLEALATGKVDAYIDVLSVGAYLIAANGMSNLQVAASTPYQHNFSIGVRKDWPELVSILNIAIEQLPLEKKNQFLKKWLVVKYEKEIDYTLLFWVLAVALFIFLLLALRAREMGKINAQLTEGRERLALTLEAAELGTFELRFQRDEAPRFFYDETFAVHHCLEQQIEFKDVDEFFEYISPEHSDQVRKQLRRYVKGEISEFKSEYQSSRNNHWISVQGRIFERDGKGWAHRIIGISQDINERKQAQITLEKSSQFKSQFLANMSHEIRTPMNAIVGLGHLLSTSGLTEKQAGYVNTLQKSAKILLGLIDDILDFSKIEAGHLRIDHVEFNLEDLLKDLADMTSLRITQENLEFIIDVGNDLPRNLIGDSFRLNQVLNNLVSNAIKFTEQGNIILRVHLEDHTDETVMLTFSVIDSGIGIQKSSLATLFDPFIQEDGSTTRKYGGTGLGLSISKQLTQLMGGELHAESEKGKGSTFYFTLPFKLAANDHQQVLLSPPSTDLRGMKVLIADDNPTSLEVLTDTLSSLSFKVSSVNSGAKAIQALMQAADKFDILLIDWRMPDKDGITTTAEIRSTLSDDRMPLIILMTAYGKDAIELDSTHLQLDGILIKPITPSSLFNAIMQARQNALIDSSGRSERVATAPSIKPLKGSVILAEDNPINQQVAQEILQQMGITVTVCQNGTEVIKQLEQTTPDLILMDIQMPEMDGYETTHIIRSQEKYNSLPIVAMTANAMKEDIQKSIAVGMQDHISKPVNPNLLYQTLARHLKFEQKAPLQNSTDSPEPAQHERKWPSAIPGLNIKRGIKQVGGNENLYQKLLTEFLHNHKHLRKDLNIYIQQGDLDQAARSVHTLKGVSGNIGAERLYNITSEIDSKLKKSEAIDSKLLDEFSLAYNELCQGIKQLNTHQSDTLDTTTGTNEEADVNIYQLLDALQKNDASSRSLLDQLNSQLEQAIGPRNLERLSNLVQDYEFEQAAQELGQFLKGSDNEL